jgi:hypothetical protein
MPKPGPVVPDGGREGEEPPVVELSATEMFQSSLYAFTVRYEVPENWTGRIVGQCPDWAPMYVQNALYSPEWQPLIDDGSVPNIIGAPIGLSSWRVNYGRNLEYLNGMLATAAAEGWPLSPAAPFTLYVTQVCGSVVALTPAG